MAQGKATIDHERIKSWVEERGGCPAHIKGSGDGRDPGILRIDYSGFSGKHSLEAISWDEFFGAFEDNKLAFLYQEDVDSRFSKLVSRDSVTLADGQKRGGKRARATKRAASKAKGKKKGKINALDLLEQQHRDVEALFEKLESAKSAPQKELVFGKLADSLAAHAKIEETMFYPAAFGEETETELREAVEEHLVAKRLLADLIDMEPSDPQFDSKVSVLKEVVQHHVREEEETLFDMVREQDVEDLEVLGQQMRRRYVELMKSSPREAVPRETRSAQAPF